MQAGEEDDAHWPLAKVAVHRLVTVTDVELHHTTEVEFDADYSDVPNWAQLKGAPFKGDAPPEQVAGGKNTARLVEQKRECRDSETRSRFRNARLQPRHSDLT